MSLAVPTGLAAVHFPRRSRGQVLVRPFVVRGETPDDGLGPALIEELAAQLAHRGVDRIDVLTRAPEAGDCAARACYRVEGSIRVAGDRVRVLASLIDGRDETHRWGSGFDRDVADVLSLTTDVASAIADAIVAHATRSDAAAPPGSLGFELLRQHREVQRARVGRQQST